MRTGIDPKGGSRKRILPTQPDMQLHHGGSSLNNARAFFNKLDPSEKLLMEREFAKYGIVPGDVTMNALAMRSDQHQAGIHKIERELNLEGKQYFKEGASFQDKLKAVKQFAGDQRTLQKSSRRDDIGQLVLKKLVVLHVVFKVLLHLKSLNNTIRLKDNVERKLLEILKNTVLKHIR